jgi:hypothetical protein
VEVDVAVVVVEGAAGPEAVPSSSAALCCWVVEEPRGSDAAAESAHGSSIVGDEWFWIGLGCSIVAVKGPEAR